MKIACPKESKSQEHRVGLTPDSVKVLVDDGHEVWMESNAGLGIGQGDEQYRQAGARIAADLDEVFARGELIIKVKEPNAEERSKLAPGHTLFTYLHLASDPEQTQDLANSEAICIAYETVTDKDQRLPLLTPMSVIAGRLSVQEAVIHLEKHHGGLGVLLSGAPGVESESVVIVGGGVVGSNAARIALGLGARVTILDRSRSRLEELNEAFSGAVNCLYSDQENLAAAVRDAALVIGAVLIPGSRANYVISSDMVKTMRPGSVIADVAIDQGGCCENSRPTTHDQPTFVKDGVIHYCVANIPGAVPLTASQSLNSATLPYIRDLAGKGTKRALTEDAHLLNGLNVCRGRLTRAEIAEDLNSLGLPYQTAAEAVAALV
jgi:alanine dehydrogenase